MNIKFETGRAYNGKQIVNIIVGETYLEFSDTSRGMNGVIDIPEYMHDFRIAFGMSEWCAKSVKDWCSWFLDQYDMGNYQMSTRTIDFLEHENFQEYTKA